MVARTATRLPLPIIFVNLEQYSLATITITRTWILVNQETKKLETKQETKRNFVKRRPLPPQDVDDPYH